MMQDPGTSLNAIQQLMQRRNQDYMPPGAPPQIPQEQDPMSALAAMIRNIQARNLIMPVTEGQAEVQGVRG